MGWLKRIFGMEKPQNAQVNPSPQVPQTASATATQSIPPERLGLNGEYDQSGLAKRVALAFEQDAQLKDIESLWVAQTSATVVLKGKVSSQEILNKIVSVARSVQGTSAVDTTQVTIG